MNKVNVGGEGKNETVEATPLPPKPKTKKKTGSASSK
jgi:hypothetical protein